MFPLFVVVTAALISTPFVFWVRKLPLSPSSMMFPAAVNAAEAITEPPYISNDFVESAEEAVTVEVFPCVTAVPPLKCPE